MAASIRGGVIAAGAGSRLRADGWIRSGERVVLLNTGTGLIYPDVTP